MFSDGLDQGLSERRLLLARQRFAAIREVSRVCRGGLAPGVDQADPSQSMLRIGQFVLIRHGACPLWPGLVIRENHPFVVEKGDSMDTSVTEPRVLVSFFDSGMTETAYLRRWNVCLFSADAVTQVLVDPIHPYLSSLQLAHMDVSRDGPHGLMPSVVENSPAFVNCVAPLVIADFPMFEDAPPEGFDEETDILKVMMGRSILGGSSTMDISH